MKILWKLYWVITSSWSTCDFERPCIHYNWQYAQDLRVSLYYLCAICTSIIEMWHCSGHLLDKAMPVCWHTQTYRGLRDHCLNYATDQGDFTIYLTITHISLPFGRSSVTHRPFRSSQDANSNSSFRFT